MLQILWLEQHHIGRFFFLTKKIKQIYVWFSLLYSIRANQLLAYTVFHILSICSLLALCTCLQFLGYGTYTWTHIYMDIYIMYTQVFRYGNRPNWLFFSVLISPLTPVKESVFPPFGKNCNPWNICHFSNLLVLVFAHTNTSFFSYQNLSVTKGYGLSRT